ncbi:MAG: hypothetical protein EOO93_02655 [Pedobacter sp.]|nr:MAG: hypothetical protein EOO93_02655 [Pedobacter sp.]
MIRNHNFAGDNPALTILKINPPKLKELLAAFEVNKRANLLTIFAKIDRIGPKEEVIYTEKSELDLAFEAFQDQEV